MKAAEVLRKVREWRGEIAVQIHGRNTTTYVKAVKRDVLRQLSGITDNDFQAVEYDNDGILYIEAASF